MIFTDADATGFEEDARQRMWLWNLSTAASNGNGATRQKTRSLARTRKTRAQQEQIGGFVLEYDAARKIAKASVPISNSSRLDRGERSTARLLPVAERTRSLFQKGDAPSQSSRQGQEEKCSLSWVRSRIRGGGSDGGWGDTVSTPQGETVLDRVHQSMILFGAGPAKPSNDSWSTTAAGRDDRFWRLAQAFSALYPASTDEKRWSTAWLARKRSLGSDYGFRRSALVWCVHGDGEDGTRRRPRCARPRTRRAEGIDPSLNGHRRLHFPKMAWHERRADTNPNCSSIARGVSALDV